MTIATSANSISYTGDGVSVAFAFPYPFIVSTDLKVYVAGVLQTTGYSVAGVAPVTGSGTFATGTVTFVTAPAAATTVLIYCDPDLLQSTSLPPNDPFPSKTVEKMIDKATLQIQRLASKFANALRAPEGETGTFVTGSAASRAGTVYGFDAAGNYAAVAVQASTSFTYGQQVIDSFTGDGSTTVFALSTNPGLQSNLTLVLGGVVQDNGVDFTWVSGTTLTFTTAPPLGVTIRARYVRSLPMGTSDAGSTTFSPTTTYSTGTVGRFLASLRNFLTDWGALGNGTTDDTAAATSTGTIAAKGFLDVASAGVFFIDPKTIPVQQHWRGLGWTAISSTRPGSTLLKRSNGTHLALTGDYASAKDLHLDGNAGAGKTGDGVQVAGTRQALHNVSSLLQQGNGFRIGGAGATGVFNANVWQAIRPIARNNTGHGVYVHHSGGTVTGQFANGTPDCNAGVMLGGDFGLNTLTGMTIDNTIDNLFLAPVVQTNTGKGIVLTANSQGNVLLKAYAEANNGGAGAFGDEIDIAAGSYNNVVFASRSVPSASGSGIKDAAVPGKNLVLVYESGIGTGAWTWRAQFNLWNPKQDASSTTVDFNAYLSSNQANVYSMIGSLTGTSGGILTFSTKIDGGARTDALQLDALQRSFTLAAHVAKRTAPTYSASITIDAATCNSAEITASNGTAFTINNPTNPSDGQHLTITIRNTSGGVLGTITWGAAFKMAAWTSPATANSRSMTVRYNGTNWVEITRTAADVPN